MFLKSIRKKSSVIMSEFDYKCKTVRRNKGIICRENGEIVINKIKNLKDSSNIQKKKIWDNSSELYLFKRWNSSNYMDYVSDEFKTIRITN